MMASAKDRLVSEFSKRLHDRNLFKCIDVREALNQKLGSKTPEALTRGKGPKSTSPTNCPAKQQDSFTERDRRIDALDKACYAVEKRIFDLKRENVIEIPQLLEDKPPERSIYKPFAESKGPLNQIMIRPGFGDDKPVDVASVSQVIKAIAPFKAYRVYIRDGEEKAKMLIDQIVEEEAKRCR